MDRPRTNGQYVGGSRCWAEPVWLCQTERGSSHIIEDALSSIGREGVIVAREIVLTSNNLIGVAHAVVVQIGSTVATTDIHSVELVPIAVTIAVGNAGTATVENGAGAVADSTFIEAAYAIVLIVTGAIAVGICRAASPTHAKGVGLVAVAVTVTGGNAVSTAHTTLVELVAVAVAVAGGNAVSTAHTAFVELISVAIAVAGRDAATAAHSAFVQLVACAIAIPLRNAIAAAHSTCIELLAGPVVHGGLVVVVARGGVGATGRAAGAGRKRERVLDQLGLVTVGENLDEELPAEVAVRGGLGKEDFLVVSGNAVGAARQDVPTATDG